MKVIKINDRNIFISHNENARTYIKYDWMKIDKSPTCNDQVQYAWILFYFVNLQQYKRFNFDSFQICRKMLNIMSVLRRS